VGWLLEQAQGVDLAEGRTVDGQGRESTVRLAVSPGQMELLVDLVDRLVGLGVEG